MLTRPVSKALTNQLDDIDDDISRQISAHRPRTDLMINLQQDKQAA